MSIVSEKRTGRVRRLTSGQPPVGIGERRADDRRQIIVSDIPFFEWATHFAAFQREMTSRNLEPSEGGSTAAANDEGRK